MCMVNEKSVTFLGMSNTYKITDEMPVKKGTCRIQKTELICPKEYRRLYYVWIYCSNIYRSD